MSDREPYIRTECTWNVAQQHALLSMVTYEGQHGYLTATCALTLDGLRELRTAVNAAIATAEAVMP